MLIIMGLLVIAIVVLLYLAYTTPVSSSTETSEFAERISRYAEQSVLYTAGGTGEGADVEQTPSVWRKLLEDAGDVLRKFQKVKDFDLRMTQAGLSLRGSEFLILAGGGAMSTGLLVFIISSGKVVLSLVLACLVAGGAFCWMNMKIAKRRKAFNDELSDAASMIGNAMRAGFSFLQAVNMVSEEMKPPISEEFARIVRETNLGISIDESFASLRQRVRSYDLDLFVTAVLIQREMGGNLAGIMDTISQNIRERIMADREMEALTAQGRLSGLIVGLLPVAVGGFVALTNPSYYAVMFEDHTGYWCIGIALVSYTIGIVIIRQLIKVDF